MQQESWSVDGEEVVAWRHPPAGAAKGAVVATHGFNSDCRELAGLPEALARRGWLVLAVDQRGFGSSGGERGLSTMARAVQDLRLAIDRLPKGLPVALAGHSLGASYVLEAAAQDTRAGAVVAAHPVDRLFDELNPVEKAGYHLLGRLAERRRAKGRPPGSIPFKVQYRQLFVDPAAAERAKAIGFLQRRVNLGNYRNALEASGAAAANRVRQPALVLTSEKDRVVRPAHQRRVHEALAGPKELLSHRGGHSCFGDLDGPLLADAVADWLEANLPKAGESP